MIRFLGRFMALFSLCVMSIMTPNGSVAFASGAPVAVDANAEYRPGESPVTQNVIWNASFSGSSYKSLWLLDSDNNRAKKVSLPNIDCEVSDEAKGNISCTATSAVRMESATIPVGFVIEDTLGRLSNSATLKIAIIGFVREEEDDESMTITPSYPLMVFPFTNYLNEFDRVPEGCFSKKILELPTCSSRWEYVIPGEGKWKVGSHGVDMSIDFIPESGFSGTSDIYFKFSKYNIYSIRKYSVTVDPSAPEPDFGTPPLARNDVLDARLPSLFLSTIFNDERGSQGLSIAGGYFLVDGDKKVKEITVDGVKCTGLKGEFSSSIPGPVPMNNIDCDFSEATSQSIKFRYVAYNGMQMLSNPATAVVKNISRKGGQCYGDLPADYPYARDIRWTCGTGLVDGDLDEVQLHPQENIRRADMAEFLYRASGSPHVALPERSPFYDVSATHKNYRAIVWATEQGLMKNYFSMWFGPKGTITNEVMARIISGFAKANPAKPAQNPFADVSKASRFAPHVEWLRENVTRQSREDLFYPKKRTTRAIAIGFMVRACPLNDDCVIDEVPNLWEW